MANADEAWGMGSGLALDGATVDVTNAEFGFNANIGAGIVCLNLTMEDEDGEEIEQSFSCGNKFEASRDGSTLEGGGKIIKTSNYGMLLASLAEAVDDIADDLPDFDPRVAASWDGMSLTFGSITQTTTNPTTGAQKESTKFVISEFHGYGETEEAPAPAKKAAAKKAPAKKAAASKAKADPTAAPDGVDDELWSELLALANEHDDHGDFATAALDIEAVDGNKAAQKAIMGTKAGSVWAAKEASDG